jgi:hypothetical protein
MRNGIAIRYRPVLIGKLEGGGLNLPHRLYGKASEQSAASLVPSVLGLCKRDLEVSRA